MRASTHFAECVLSAARRVPAHHRFGRKVYLRAVFAQLNHDWAMFWEEFVERMTLAHLEGHLTMARADLVQDVALTEASEIRYETTTWHYLEVSA